MWDSLKKEISIIWEAKIYIRGAIIAKKKDEMIPIVISIPLLASAEYKIEINGYKKKLKCRDSG